MKKLFLGSLASAVLLATPLLKADDKKDVVIAKVADKEIRRCELDALVKARGLEKFPIEQVYDQLLDELVQRAVVQKAFEASDLGKKPEYQQAELDAVLNLKLKFLMETEAKKLVKDADRKKIYEGFNKTYKDKVEIQPSIIELDEEDNAKKAIEYLKKGDAFSKVSKKFNVSNIVDENGKLKSHVMEDAFPQEIVKAFKELKVGSASKDYVKVVMQIDEDRKRTRYYILKKDKKDDVRPFKLPDMNDKSIKEQLDNAAAMQKVKEVQENLLKKYKIEKFKLDGTKSFKF